MLSDSLSSIGQEIKLKGHVCWEKKEESRNHKSWGDHRINVKVIQKFKSWKDWKSQSESGAI